MRQRGTCVSSCPRGHYGKRSPHISTCASRYRVGKIEKCLSLQLLIYLGGNLVFCQLFGRECWENTRNMLTKVHFHWPAGCKGVCASCFSESFCTHCHAGHFLFRGKCESSCPDGLMANAALRECTGETLVQCVCVCVMMSMMSGSYRVWDVCACPSVSECSFGCEMCVSRAVCAGCREDLFALQGQCHLTCPRGFEPDLLLMQCVPQGERNSRSRTVKKWNSLWMRSKSLFSFDF